MLLQSGKEVPRPPAIGMITKAMPIKGTH
eukprot:COSAG06_NODE_35028_length_465_cov_1.538251_2_plen_28_part_01